MRIVLLGLFAADYVGGLANGLASHTAVSLFVSRQDLEAVFPDQTNLPFFLLERKVFSPEIDLHLVDYPKGQYGAKIDMTRRLLEDIRRIRPDIVHVQVAGDPWMPMVLTGCPQYGRVATIHDVTAHPGDRPSPRIRSMINAWTVRAADTLIVHGQQQSSLLRQRYHVPLEKVNVLPIGPYDLFMVYDRRGIEEEPATILFFGRMRAYKGLEVLLRAAPQIVSAVPGARIVAAGAGNCPALMEAAASHPVWLEVHNRFIRADEIPELFRRASLVVLPYLEASQSGVVPVAAMFGKPVVATRVGSIPESVDDGVTGLLVNPGDENALAREVIALLKDPQRRHQMGQSAHQKMRKEISWDSIALQTLDVYRRTLGEPVFEAHREEPK